MSEAAAELSALLDWLYAQQRFGIKPGLERVRALLAALGQPQRAYKVVLVGGTNGKGSVTSSLAAVLQANGERVGLFTSPHLTHFGERFLVNGAQPTDQALAEALADLRPHAEKLEATFFEIVTVLGCILFARAGVSVAVMEVGLGGRLDATNALDPVLSVLTNVSFDHTDVLGGTLAAIATEKAGILRQGRPAVTAFSPELWPMLEPSGADVWALGRDFSFQLHEADLQGVTFTLQAAGERLRLHSPLLGVHGAQNAALAAAAAVRLGCAAPAVQAGLARTTWAGRLERLQARGRTWLLDGAHNPAGAQALAEALRLLQLAPCRLVFGMSEDKDAPEIVRPLAEIASDVVLTAAALSPRAAEPQSLRAAWEQAGVPVRVAATPQAALDVAEMSAETVDTAETVVVCGSLYLVGECRALLLEDHLEQRERWQ